jgi:uncharacterized membrane protein YgdD (TMEM256/DUF423 family)
MNKNMILAGAAFALLAVMSGAFGAHALKTFVSEKTLGIYETAVRYQMYHAVALVITGILYREFNTKWLKMAAWFFAAGIFLFCFSLYTLVMFRLNHNEMVTWPGAITPVGGLCFIAGWIMIMVSLYRKRDQ